MKTALWLFVEVENLEPTNNSAERAIRRAVLWKKTSFGSQSENGSLFFVARMLTVVSSLRSQNLSVLKFIIETIEANRQGNQTPSLIPTVHQVRRASSDDRDFSDDSIPLVAYPPERLPFCFQL